MFLINKNSTNIVFLNDKNSIQKAINCIVGNYYVAIYMKTMDFKILFFF